MHVQRVRLQTPHLEKRAGDQPQSTNIIIFMYTAAVPIGYACTRFFCANRGMDTMMQCVSRQALPA